MDVWVVTVHQFPDSIWSTEKRAKIRAATLKREEDFVRYSKFTINQIEEEEDNEYGQE